MPFWKDPSRRLLSPEDEARIVEAIRQGERRTSAELRVHVEARCEGDPIEHARRCFAALGMAATEARNGVLVYLAVDDREFAIVGDRGAHGVLGDAFWSAMRDRLETRLREGRAGDGIIEVLLEVARGLSEAYPRRDDDRNELPDEVSFGPPGPAGPGNL